MLCNLMPELRWYFFSLVRSILRESTTHALSSSHKIDSSTIETQMTSLCLLGHLWAQCCWGLATHDDVIKWKHFPRYWPFVRGIHRSPVNSPHKGQCRGAPMFSLICVWINGWVNNSEAGDSRRHRAHYDVNVMWRINITWVLRYE